ncbi:hypothetical protein X744_07615 [Mesorhizobium sp. LNJC372A00]|nr:hypothetical protein X745_00890 [Mesorhizobium sp. LNJC374B00]ESY60671.1 hypothetical protein X744_07615 [Mesorhizobium sp. LNJC372A00]
MGARSPKALDFELKRAIADGAARALARARRTKEPVAKAVGLLSLEIATALGFNARHV